MRIKVLLRTSLSRPRDVKGKLVINRDTREPPSPITNTHPHAHTHLSLLHSFSPRKSLVTFFYFINLSAAVQGFRFIFPLPPPSINADHGLLPPCSREGNNDPNAVPCRSAWSFFFRGASVLRINLIRIPCHYRMS